MNIEVLSNPESVAQHAASVVAEKARRAVAERGIFVLAVSGGHTPWLMLRALADEKIPWPALHVFQVDERVAPAGDPDRNLTHLLETLLEHAPVRPEQIHAMPVESPDLHAATAAYARKLVEIAGTPAVLDVVHLGLGPDGHTASLISGDPALDVDKEIAITGIYQGRRRMTMTYPLINRSRHVLWIVTGQQKAQTLKRLMDGDETMPAGRIHRDQALVLADEAAANGRQLVG